MSTERSPKLPGVLTLAEAGLHGLDITTRFALMVTAATPVATQQRLHDALVAATSNPACVKALDDQALETYPALTQAATQAAVGLYFDSHQHRRAADNQDIQAMPFHTCIHRDGLLDDASKQTVARGITDIRCELAGAPRHFRLGRSQATKEAFANTIDRALSPGMPADRDARHRRLAGRERAWMADHGFAAHAGS